jgi:hypothetical protein
MIFFHTFSIKKLFFPETFDTYFNWKQRIVGIEITESHVLATLLYASGAQRTIERFFDIPIQNVNNVIELETKDGKEKEAELMDPHYLGLLQALKELQQKVGPVDKVFCTIPLQQLIFKDLKMEITDQEKIQKLLPFELENTLPFAAGEAAFSGAMLQKNIYTAVVGKMSTVDYYEKLFTDAGFSLDKLSTNSFEMYALLSAANIVAHSDSSVPFILIHANEHNSFVLIQSEKNQTIIKAIPPLIINNELRAENGKTVSLILRAALQKSVVNIADISVYITGSMTVFPQLVEQCAQVIGCKQCIGIESANILAGIVTLPAGVEKLGEKMIASIALAAYLSITMYCNLLDKKLEKKEDRLLGQQLVTAGILFAIIFLSLSGNGFLRKQHITTYNSRAEKEAIEMLRTTFKLKTTKRASLEGIKNSAKEELSKQESIWYALSPGNRDSFLSYLQELSTHINRAELGLNLKKIELKTTEDPKRDTLSMVGSVQDWGAVRAFDAVWPQMPMATEIPMTQSKEISFTVNLNKNYRKVS